MKVGIIQLLCFGLLFSSVHSTLERKKNTVIKSSNTNVVNAILAAAEVARFSVRKSATTNITAESIGWLPGMWFEAGSCIRKDYKRMKVDCTRERLADQRDPCAVPTPHDRRHHQSTLFQRLVSVEDLEQSGQVIDLLKPAISSLLPHVFNASGLPAIVHHTWKSEDVGEEIDFKKQIDEWQDVQWIHLLWTDQQLNRLISTVIPWMGSTLQRLRRPVDKIDCMRYILLFIFGGVYLDADMVTTKYLKRYFCLIYIQSNQFI